MVGERKKEKWVDAKSLTEGWRLLAANEKFLSGGKAEGCEGGLGRKQKRESPHVDFCSGR